MTRKLIDLHECRQFIRMHLVVLGKSMALLGCDGTSLINKCPQCFDLLLKLRDSRISPSTSSFIRSHDEYTLPVGGSTTFADARRGRHRGFAFDFTTPTCLTRLSYVFDGRTLGNGGRSWQLLLGHGASNSTRDSKSRGSQSTFDHSHACRWQNLSEGKF